MNLSLFKRCVPAIMCAAFISGCSIGRPSLPQFFDKTDPIAESVLEEAKKDGLAHTDADIITTLVTEAPIGIDVSMEKPIKPLAWRNPETGSSGTVVAINNFMGRDGQQCRGFKTSVTTFMGIAFYNGEACRISAGEWILSFFKPSESSQSESPEG